MRVLTLLCAALALTGSAGCTLLVDGTLTGRPGPGTDAGDTPDAGTDAEMADAGPPVGACTGMPDGRRCAPEGIVDPFVCVDEICVSSRCGDGAIDERDGSDHEPELCDDGNDIAGDGCENDCTFSCTDDDDCDDLEACTGTETCDTTMNVCVPGTPTDGAECEIDGSTEDATCSGGICRAGACPDGALNAGEECDPATPATNDGCEDDCTFTCETNVECQDADRCNGDETCDTTTHLCVAAAAPLACDDAEACTADSCVAATGCINATVLVDADGDGHAAITASCGGDDCNDADRSAYPGATEACGATADLNCDGAVGTTPTYYRDCDGDGYAASTAGSVSSCTAPAAVSGCAAWVTLAPTSATTTDCFDMSSSARPRQTTFFRSSVTGLMPAFDYDCNDDVERELSTSTSATVPPRGDSSACPGSGRCTGDAWYVATREPACGTEATVSLCGLPPRAISCTRTTTTATVECR